MPKKRTPNKSRSVARAIATYDRIKMMRKKVDAGQITKKELHELLEVETLRNEWASRVQLQAIARDLLPVAAAQARKGRSRLLAVVANVLLKTEMTEIGDKVAEQFTQFVITHAIPRPDPTPKPDRSQYDPELQSTIEEIVGETLEKQVGEHADKNTTKH